MWAYSSLRGNVIILIFRFHKGKVAIIFKKLLRSSEHRSIYLASCLYFFKLFEQIKLLKIVTQLRFLSECKIEFAFLSCLTGQSPNKFKTSRTQTF